MTKSTFSTPAILIRRIDHGDFDLILTFLTRERGKIPAMAKNAKKSVKRFSGVLELFYILDIVCTQGRGKLPILKEASVRRPFINIRSSIEKTAYASYWAQLVYQWMEEGEADRRMFGLFQKSLEILDEETLKPGAASILFQTKFLAISGVDPNLDRCGRCGRAMEDMPGERLVFDLAGGGLLCNGCAPEGVRATPLSKGAVKHLKWIGEKPAGQAFRIRFSPGAQQEILEFLETFTPFHLGVRPKSLSFLRKLREGRRGCE